MLLGEAHESFVDWLITTRSLSAHTVRAYDGDVAALRTHLGADMPVSTFTGASIISFVTALRDAGASDSSIRRRVAGVRSFSRWLALTEIIEFDPWRELPLRLPVPRTLPRAVPRRELHRLIRFLVASAGLGAEPAPVVFEQLEVRTTLLAVGLMLATGIRVSELVSIRRYDVDITGASIRVMGKGRRERTVYLPSGWLPQLCSSYVGARLQLGIVHDLLLFNGKGAPLSPAAVRSRLAKAGRRAGLEQTITPHMLRHSAATQLIEAGVDIRYVQRLLGHASITTTEAYTHITDQSLRYMINNANVLEAIQA